MTNIVPPSAYHTSSHTMATALRRLADRLDDMPGPIALTSLGVTMQVSCAKNPYSSGVTDELRALTAQRLAAALGFAPTDLEFVEEIQQYKVAFQPRTTYQGLMPTIFGEMARPTPSSLIDAEVVEDVPALTAEPQPVGLLDVKRWFGDKWDKVPGGNELSKRQRVQIAKRCREAGWDRDAWLAIYKDVTSEQAASVTA